MEGVKILKKRRPTKLTKIVLFMFVVIGICVVFFSKNMIQIDSKAAVVMDAVTGEVIFKKNAHTAYPVASISKLMTELIVLDYIEAGRLDWDEPVVMSVRANDLIGDAVKIPVATNDQLLVKDLFTAMVVSSANNATIALAEHVAGTEEAFTDLMNEKAVEIGLSDDAYFVNATGLPNPEFTNMENTMSALDVGALASVLLETHGNVVLRTANLEHYHIVSHGIDVYSTNKLLADGKVDGLKTGYTDAAGYGFVGTEKRVDKRVISVVIDAGHEDLRFIESEKLLAYGFGEQPAFSVKELAKQIRSKVRNIAWQQ